MVRVCLSVILLLLITALAYAQAVNPARQYEQQRNTQSPAYGVWHVYDRYGNLQKEENYKAYRLDGDVKTFYPSGELKALTPYVDGERQGLEKTYYEKGALESQNIYANNDLNDLSRHYYDTGELEREAYYKDGQLNGTTKIYYKSGNMKQQLRYIRGIIDGTVLTYSKDGHLNVEDDYQKGILMAHKDYTKETAKLIP
ncbi:MAG: toxin-antitoxin system YwqK family antitoxin [Candidatus Omnitrophica bacterium]|nr:toxin-antitoxin system YwqK family antitoxin [Candidatus Omnitrophota bacterium]